MGYLDYFRNGGGQQSGSLFYRPQGGAQPQAPKPEQVGQSRGRGFPERFEVKLPQGNAFHELSQSGTDVFAAAGRYPGQVTETPVALFDRIARQATGGSPVDAIGRVPGVGAALGFAGEALERTGNFIPALLNAQDARMLVEYGSKGDNFELPWHTGQREDGAPILGAVPGLQLLFSRAKTVGELKRELEQRGFLNDPKTGERRTWDQVLGALKSGQTSTFDFGYASINDNPLVDLAGRIALDPTNALFLVPGANVAKAAQVGTKIAKAAQAGEVAARIVRPVTNVAADMVRTGLRAPKLPAPVVAKQAVATGDAANVTVRGLSAYYNDLLRYPASATLRMARSVGQRAVDPRGYLGLTDGALTAGTALGRTGQAVARGARGYAKSSAALSATLATTGNVAGRIDEALGGQTFFQGYHDFVQDVENDNPLSESAAWMVASAFSFPYGDLVRAGKAGIGPETLRAFGHDFEPALARAFNLKTPRALQEALGGPDKVSELVVYLLKHRAKRDIDSRPAVGQRIGSAPEAAMRAQWSDEALSAQALRLLRENKVSGDDLVEMLRDWHADQMGYRTLEGQSLVGDARSAPFDPALALRDWKRWAEAQSGVGAVLQVLADGQMQLGLRNYLFVEQFDVIRSRLGTGLKDSDVVPQSVIRDVMSAHPALAISDSLGYWKNAALPDAKPVTWGSVRRKLQEQSKNAPSYAETIGPAKLAEDRAGRETGLDAPEPHDQHMARLADELERHRSPDGEILDNDRSRAIRAELDADKARAGEVTRAKRRTAETKQHGPETAKALDKLDKASESVIPDLPLDPTTWWFDAERRTIAQDAERAILEIDPTYTVKALPKSEVLVQMRDTAPALYQAVRTRTLLGELLFDRGPVAPLTGFMKALMRPVKADRMARAARQSLYQRMIPHGAKPEAVDRWIDLLAKQAEMLTVAPRGQTYRMFRDVSSLPASTINKVAREAFGENSKIVREFDGRFHDVLDMASSPMWRKVREQSRNGGRRGQLARSLEQFGEFYREDIPAAADVGRLVGKTFYHWFRFLLDPRWHALNLMERNFLGGVEDGIRKGSRELSTASQFYASGARRPVERISPEAQKQIARAEKRMKDGKLTEAQFTELRNRLTADPLIDALDSGWYYGRGLEAWIARSFDARRMDSTMNALDGLAQQDVAALGTIRRRMRREAEADLTNARARHEAGEIDAAELARIEGRTNLDIENSTGDLAKLLDEKLYEFDQKGVKATLQESAARILDAEEMRVMQPLLDVLYESNEQMWRDVNRLYHGNPQRSTLERLANSYWLYWPISYQIKATKWLAGAMLDGSFGHDNGALLAGKYAAWHEQHEERFKNNPAYAAMFKENPELWFMAQMVVPMTPDGLGVSLSRPTRLAGSWAGIFGDYKQVQGPLTAASYITNLGPIYTWHLLQDIEDDIAGRDRFEITSPQSTPSPPSTLPAPQAPSIP